MANKLRVCDYCGIWIEKNEILYEMTITLRAEPITEIPSVKGTDYLRDLESLIQHMERLSDEQIADAVDQVHETHEFTLCADCRKQVHQELKARRRLMEGDL